MQLDQGTIDRYQPGGDLYASIQSQYGNDAANAAASAAATGSNDTLNLTLSNIRRGTYTVGSPNGGTSTWGNFFSQLYNDPLGAPLQQAGVVASNTASDVNSTLKGVLGSLFSNPLTLLLTLAVGGVVVWLLLRKLKLA
jgi:hypothetical protein